MLESNLMMPVVVGCGQQAKIFQAVVFATVSAMVSMFIRRQRTSKFCGQNDATATYHYAAASIADLRKEWMGTDSGSPVSIFS